MTDMTPVKPFLPAIPLIYAYVHKDRPFDRIRCVDPWVRDRAQTQCMSMVTYPYRIAPCLRVHGLMHELHWSEVDALESASAALAHERNTP